jgi:hypothetical protein
VEDRRRLDLAHKDVLDLLEDRNDRRPRDAAERFLERLVLTKELLGIEPLLLDHLLVPLEEEVNPLDIGFVHIEGSHTLAGLPSRHASPMPITRSNR